LSARIVFMGSPAFAVPALEALVAAEYNVVSVYTQPDKPAGRGLALAESPVKRAALAHGLTVETPRTLRGEPAAAWLAFLRPDAVIVAAYAKILPEPILAVPEYGCINVHPSLLPRHRGASPIPAAILAGDDFTGVSIMLMEKGLDTGAVLAQTWVPLRATDTTGSLTEKLALVAARQLTTTLARWLRGEILPCVQAEEQATYSSTISRESGCIDWTQPAVAIDRAVRAYNPWPTAYTKWRGKELKIHVAVPLSGETGCPAGTVVALSNTETPVGVATGKGVLGLKEVQLEGKKRVPTVDFVRGARDFIGSVLGA
jgi:methionyl-tRNA formyltransferase